MKIWEFVNVVCLYTSNWRSLPQVLMHLYIATAVVKVFSKLNVPIVWNEMIRILATYYSFRKVRERWKLKKVTHITTKFKLNYYDVPVWNIRMVVFLYIVVDRMIFMWKQFLGMTKFFLLLLTELHFSSTIPSCQNY